MRTPEVTIRFDTPGSVYRPGETLAGEYRVLGLRTGQLRAVEISVLWYTAGKGDEDLVVHQFVRRSADDDDLPDPGERGRFETELPRSPLSYDGMIVKIHWCVRVRAFLQAGVEVVGEQPFRLGRVPSVEEAAT